MLCQLPRYRLKFYVFLICGYLQSYVHDYTNRLYPSILPFSSTIFLQGLLCSFSKLRSAAENLQQFQDGCTIGFDYIELLAVTVNHDRAKRIKSRERKENGSKIMHNHLFTPNIYFFWGSHCFSKANNISLSCQIIWSSWFPEEQLDSWLLVYVTIVSKSQVSNCASGVIDCKLRAICLLRRVQGQTSSTIKIKFCGPRQLIKLISQPQHTIRANQCRAAQQHSA